MSTDRPESPTAEPYRDILAYGPPSTRPSERPEQAPAGAPEQATTQPAGPPLTVVAPGELSARPYPGVASQGAPPPPVHPGPRPARARPSFGRAVKLALSMIFGVGFAGIMVAIAAQALMYDLDVEVPMQRATQVDLPPAQTRWIWVPEGHVDDVACTAMDTDGAQLPMSPIPVEDHEDFQSAFGFPTGNGSVTLTCDVTVDADPNWQPAGATVKVGEPEDRAYVPLLQTGVLLFIGGPAVGALMLVVALFVRIGWAIATAVTPKEPKVRFDINTSTAWELERIPGIGRVAAANIVEWRSTHGPFSSPQELLRVPGIGPSKLRKASPHVRV